MAAGNTGVKTRILLDTTYLLPTLGVEVEDISQVLEALQRLRQEGLVELYYSDFSLLEACAKAARLGIPLSALEAGITAIMAGYTRAATGADAWLLAVKLRRDGLRDFIDAILYATAATTNLRLLTRDEKLVEFLRQRNYPLKHIILEQELKEIARRH